VSLSQCEETDYSHHRATAEPALPAAEGRALRISNEPTAAVVAHHLDKKPKATILVLDLGGNAFNVSLLEAEEGVVELERPASTTIWW
jgi:molecular chaperone DnaK (HSP70)